jgi:cytochrome bd-type quinol oxidase subunit 2
VKIAAILAVVASVVVYVIIATTPEGDKDSHGYYLLMFLVPALPLGIIVSTAAIIQAMRRRSGRVVAIGVGSLFAGATIALLCLFFL